MSEIPDRIYLQWHGDGEPNDLGEVSEHDVTWCMDKIFKHDIAYIREDKSELSRLRKAIEEHKKHATELASKDANGNPVFAHIDGELYNALDK